MSIINNLLSRLPSWHNKEEGEKTYGFMDSIANEVSDFNIESSNLKNAIQIDTAVGIELDDIGNLFLLVRKSGETDDVFRVRIKSFRKTFVGGGTIESIKQAVSDVLNITESEVTIKENFNITGEKHLFDSTKTFTTIINNKTILDGSSVSVTGIAGSVPVTFLNGTDYIVLNDFVIFGQGGTDPDDGTIINIDYTYRSILKFSVEAPILLEEDTAAIKQSLSTTVDNAKAAGVQVLRTWILSGGDLNENVIVNDVGSVIDVTGLFYVEYPSIIDMDDVIV